MMRIAGAASIVVVFGCSSAPTSEAAAGPLGGEAVGAPASAATGLSVLPAAAAPATLGNEPGADNGLATVGTGETEASEAPRTFCSERPRRIWKLTPDQLEHTTLRLLPQSKLSFDTLASTISEAHGGFSNLAEVQAGSAPHVKELAVLADEFAEGLVTDRAAWAPCLESERPDAQCIRSFLVEFLMRAFRRPAEAAEVERYAEFFAREANERGIPKAFLQLMRAVFLSAHFQFRTELGDTAIGISPMTQYERASALSYGLSDGPPDAQLMNAAASSALTTSEQLEAQVRRLLSASESGQGITKFLTEHFGVERALAARKDDKVFPSWHWGLAMQLTNESTAFFEEVLWRDDARLSTLLTADYSMVNDANAPIYGLQPPGTSELQRRTLPAGQRSGVITQPAFLAALGGFSAPDVTQRGHFLRTVIMCQQLPAPPAEVPPIPVVEGLSRRERLERAHLENVACRGCHSLMDPLGFTLENYDSIGGWRTLELVGDTKVPLDASGTIVGSTRGELEIRGAQELGRALGDLPEVHACFVEKLSEYISGGRHAADDCRVARALETFSATNGAILEVVVALLADEQSYLRGD